jgi:hypothetical protein
MKLLHTVPVLALIGIATGPAGAQPAVSEAVRAVAGTWELSNAERDKTCIAYLKAEPVPDGARLELDGNCAATFPFTREATAWSVVDEVLRFLDGKGKTLLTVSEVESGLYEGERRGEGLFFLQNIAAVGRPERKPDQVFGDWTVIRAEKEVCVVTLVNARASRTGDNRFALKLNADCDAVVTAFGPAAWRMDRGELVLISATGDEWRFEEVEPFSWHRIPEGTDPVRLVRK